MKSLVRHRRLNQQGFSLHIILPVLTVIAVACIGAYVLHASRAATPIYKGACTATTYTTKTANTSAKAKACIQQAQDLLDGVQHQSQGKYLTATSATADTFVYGKEHYLTMNGVYSTATQTAVHRLYGNNNLTGGTVTSDGWQYLCRAAVQYGLSGTGAAGTAKLVFNSKVKGEYTSSSNATIFKATCGTPPATTTTPPPTTTPPASTGFITASGMKLMLGGAQYRSISFDFSPLGDCWDTNWTTAQMDTFFAAIPEGSMARFFAPPDSDDSATFVESIVAQANKYHDHLIVALADADVDNNCDTENASNNGKTAAYYTDAPESGSAWYNWVQSVVKPLANNSGVAIWEISNEPAHAGVNLYDGQLSQATFNTYVKNSAAVIKAAEVAGAGSAKQLISIAPADMGDIGNASGAESVFSYLNVVDDHDYSFDSTQGSPAVNPDFAIEEQVAKSLNKPFMVDEAGVEAGSCSSSTLYNAWDDGSHGTTLANRVTLLVNDKATDYFNNGNSAIDYWLYTGQGGGCSYENITTSDPIMAATRSYKMP